MNPLFKPVIGITSSSVNHNKIPSINLHDKYIESVIRAGGTPIIIPIGAKELSEEWARLCHGIILSGGEDISPHHYGENPIPKLQKTNEKRDILEIELINKVREQGKPILAICRGITILNVALGGTVIQDIETNNPHAIQHKQQASRSEATHNIQIEKNSRLYQILHSVEFRVNSMHHQAINVLAPGLKPVAFAPDGIIEAVEGIHEDSLWLGVQWHPEEMVNMEPAMQGLFDTFINECINKGKEQNS